MGVALGMEGLLGKIPRKLGWWLGVALWIRKPPIVSYGFIWLNHLVNHADLSFGCIMVKNVGQIPQLIVRIEIEWNWHIKIELSVQSMAIPSSFCFDFKALLRPRWTWWTLKSMTSIGKNVSYIFQGRKPNFSNQIVTLQATVTGWWFEPLWKIWVRQLGWLETQY